jgi:WD40 repeat protein
MTGLGDIFEMSCKNYSVILSKSKLGNRFIMALSIPSFTCHAKSESAMKQREGLRLLLVFILTTLLLDACSFSVEVLPTLTPFSPAPEATPVPATPTTIPSTDIPPTASPTLIQITAGTIGWLEIFMTIRHGDVPRALAFTPDNTVLVSAGGNTEDFSIRLWDVASGESLGTLDGHTDIVWGVAFSPDGQMLASVSRDATARVWDWRNGTLIKSLDFPGDAVSVSFSPDGRILAVGGVDEPLNQIQNAAVWTYSIDSWRPLIKFPEYLDIGAMAYTPDGRFLVGGGTSRNVQVWRTGDGTSIFTLNHSHQVSDIVVSADGVTAAAATCGISVNDECTEGSVWVWNLSNGRLIQRLAGYPDVVESVAFSVDGQSLIAMSRGGLLRVYAIHGPADYQSVFEATPHGENGVMALSPDGRLLATGSADGQIHLWKIVYRP